MPELNISSHRYQSSKTEGQMSEDNSSPAFEAGTKTSYCYEMTFDGSQSERGKSRTSKQTRLLEQESSTRWRVSGSYPEKMQAANVCYQLYLTAYDRSRSGPPVKRTPLLYRAFWTIYRGETPQDFQVTAKKLAVLNLPYFADDVQEGIDVNFDMFPNASPINTIKELAKKEPTPVPTSTKGYTPQSGEIPSTGNLAFQTVRAKCVGELTNASALDLTVFKTKLTELLPSHEQGYDILLFMSAFVLAYMCYRIVTDLILSLVWGCGFVVAKMLGTLQKHKNQQSFLDTVFTPQGSARRLGKIRKFRDMAPQAGNLGSDDGSAFLGIKPKSKVTSPKKNPPKQPASSTPSAPETIQWSGLCAFGGPPKPKRDQTQFNGPLNGFGAGL